MKACRSLSQLRARLSSQNTQRLVHGASQLRLSSTSAIERPPFETSPTSKPTQPPNPNWKLGSGLDLDVVGAEEWKKDEEAGWKSFNLEEMAPRDAYRMLTSAIVPRPIAFVSTLAADGAANLAPMSYFSMISHDPPICTVSFSMSTRGPKDTRENILATKEFVVNIISEPFVEAANASSAQAPPDVDEWVISGLTQKPSLFVKPASVQESAISLECELYQHIDIPNNTGSIGSTLVLGKIRHASVRNAVLNSDGLTIDPHKLRPIARFGGTTYARIGDSFDSKRVSWKGIQEAYEKLLAQKVEDA